MIDLIDRHTTLARGLLARGISVLFMAWFMLGWMPVFAAHSGDLPPLDMRLWYSAGEAGQLLDALGDDGGAFYLEMIAGDFVFIGFAAVGDLMLLGLLLRHLGWPGWPRQLLLAAVVADGIENVVTAAVLLGAPRACFWLGGLATLLKQCAAVTLLVVYACGLLALAWRRLIRAGDP